MDMECEIFMGEEDTKRQALNVFRMELLGAKVHPVRSGTGTLKDAVNETMREWVTRISDIHYVLGSVMGPHLFPTLVRDFQKIIGEEIREQILEAEGRGVDTKRTAATISTGRVGIFHGMKSLFCQDEYGQIAPVYSISAGLDYPGVGPEHAMLWGQGRAEYVPVTDDEAVEAFTYLSRTEGIILAIESAHAVAYGKKLAKEMSADQILVITVSGRGDKDVAAIAR